MLNVDLYSHCLFSVFVIDAALTWFLASDINFWIT